MSWGLVIGDMGLDPIPNHQSPIPNPQSPEIFFNLYKSQIFPQIKKFILKIKNGNLSL